MLSRYAAPMIDHALRFAELHQDFLILPNAWDVGSARLAAAAGAQAIATTSAGVAWSLGYPDGDALPVPLYREVVRAIAAAVPLPVSADIESGYADDIGLVGEHVRDMIDAGAVGINIEDGGGPPALLAAKIGAARAAGEALGVGLFVNARCDVWLRGLAPEDPMTEFLARAHVYTDAGADGIFAPGLTDHDAIPIAVAGCHGLPLNLLARPGLAPAAELRRLGVRRLSAGSGITQSVYGLARRLNAAFLAGDAEPLWDGAMAYPEINALMAG